MALGQWELLPIWELPLPEKAILLRVSKNRDGRDGQKLPLAESK